MFARFAEALRPVLDELIRDALQQIIPVLIEELRKAQTPAAPTAPRRYMGSPPPPPETE